MYDESNLKFKEYKLFYIFFLQFTKVRICNSYNIIFMWIITFLLCINHDIVIWTLWKK